MERKERYDPSLYECDGWVIPIRHRVREAIFNSDSRVQWCSGMNERPCVGGIVVCR